MTVRVLRGLTIIRSARASISVHARKTRNAMYGIVQQKSWLCTEIAGSPAQAVVARGVTLVEGRKTCHAKRCAS